MFGAAIVESHDVVPAAADRVCHLFEAASRYSGISMHSSVSKFPHQLAAAAAAALVYRVLNAKLV